MQDCISVALEETEEPGAHAKGTINSGFKWTLERTQWSLGFLLKDVIILISGLQVTMCHLVVGVKGL